MALILKVRAFFVILFCVGVSFTLKGQNSVIGKWQTIDDETGKAKSIVQIFEKEKKLFGKVVALFLEPHENQDPVCEECSDHRKDQKIIGMEIISNMQWDKEDQEWKKGEILDPENGTVYDCKLWLEEGKLKVRGYLAFFFRTQTWNKVE